MTSPKTFTGRSRQKRTHWTVRAGEVLSRLFITLGGIGTIVAICLIGFFLVWTVVPLFLPANISDGQELEAPGQTGPPAARAQSRPVQLAVDEDQLAAWALFPDGKLQLLRLDTGRPIGPPRELDLGGTPTAFSGPGPDNDWLFGFADGSVRSGSIRWTTSFLDASELPPELLDLPQGQVAEFRGGLLTRAPGGLFQLHDVYAWVAPAIADLPDLGSPIRKLDHVSTGNNEMRYTALTENGKLWVVNVLTKKQLGHKPPKFEVDQQEVSLVPPEGKGPTGKGPPAQVLLDGTGLALFAIWNDGLLYRYNLRGFPEKAPEYMEAISLVDGRQDVAVTALHFLVGRSTLLVGDSTGRIRAWFTTQPDGATTGDKMVYQHGHTFEGQGAAVTALGASNRDRTMLAGYADGRVRVFYVTSEKHLAETGTSERAVEQVVLAPRNDGLLALGPTGLWHWKMDIGHPRASVRGLFLPVWYENYKEPETVWQSTGSEETEIKLGLWPLIFGTLKATFYSLLIGVPLALLAAVYTSEFLHPRLKATFKPTIELMAGLPSVVLGFLAALVFAPFINEVLPAFLASFVLVPATVLLGAYLWQLLPDKIGLRLQRLRIIFIFVALVGGLLVALKVGPLVERWLFEGDVQRWLSGYPLPDQPGKEKFGSGASGWLVLLLPVSGIGVALFLSRFVHSWLRRFTADMSHAACGAVDLVKFLAAAALTVTLAAVAGNGLDLLGFDPRGPFLEIGSLVGKYEQRNSLIVGFAMGFAIIPIIYTIAEDALSAVPEHLRSASLGCGATKWQTAVRIIIPTAMSGLFSAVMVGLGRAVGETMIVLMAAGNTPIKDLNVFNGFRSLSACIATEIPDASRGSTHYRTLYLAGLVLFALTFVLNTAAEVVRQRFRRRAYQL